MSEKRLHPRQVILEVTMGNGVTNRIVCTMANGDYSFVQNIQIEGIKVGYEELPPGDVARRAKCCRQEQGHKVPASTIRRVDGRLIGSCERCFERINVDRFPDIESIARAHGLFRQTMFNQGEPDLDEVLRVEHALKEDMESLQSAVREIGTVKALTLRRMSRREHSQKDGPV